MVVPRLREEEIKINKTTSFLLGERKNVNINQEKTRTYPIIQMKVDDSAKCLFVTYVCHRLGKNFIKVFIKCEDWIKGASCKLW